VGRAWSVLITGGLVIDGSGAPGVPANVAVEGDRIAAVGPEVRGEAGLTLDAAGLAVTPGFIDAHSHSDFFLLDCPSAESKVRQGATTEVVGMCGFSPAPVPDGPDRTALERMAATLGAPLRTDWASFAGFLERLGTRPLGVNVVPFVGHGTLRLAAMGGAARTSAPAELHAMERLLEEAMEAGAFGFSTGLVYPPGAYADTDELVALARAMARHGGLYFSHVRGEAETLETAVSEAITVGERAGVGVQVAHVKAAGRENWHRLDRALALLDGAAALGLDVMADAYPYAAGSTTMVNLLPGWTQDGAVEALVRRLAEPATRARIVAECERAGDRWQTPSGVVGWDEVLVSTCSRRELEGLSLSDLARRQGRPAAEAMLDLLREEGGAVSMVRFNQSEDNVVKALCHPRVMIGSDSIALLAGPGPHAGRPHPRTYGTFPRVLGAYVRERKALPLETAVHKMTGMPAARLGLGRRGLVRPGYFADLALFDPAAVRDEATFVDPHRYPAGIPYVIVNGQVVVDRGRMRQVAAGRVCARGAG